MCVHILSVHKYTVQSHSCVHLCKVSSFCPEQFVFVFQLVPICMFFPAHLVSHDMKQLCDLYLSFGRQQIHFQYFIWTSLCGCANKPGLYYEEAAIYCRQSHWSCHISTSLHSACSKSVLKIHQTDSLLLFLRIMSIAWSLTAVKFILKSVCCLVSSSVTRSGIISWRSHRRPDRVRWGHSDTGHHNSTTAFYLTTVSVCSHLGRLHGWAKAEREWRWQIIKMTENLKEKKNTYHFFKWSVHILIILPWNFDFLVNLI